MNGIVYYINYIYMISIDFNGISMELNFANARFMGNTTNKMMWFGPTL